jgi:hypothetical protein
VCALAVLVLAAPAAALADDPGPAEAETTAVRSIAQTTATFRASVLPHGLPTKTHFEYGTTEELTQSTPDVDVAVPGPTEGSSVAVSVPVTGLAPGAHYYVAVVAENADGGEYGSVREFDTTRVPTISPEPVADLGPFSATLHVNVTGYGLPVTVTTQVQTGSLRPRPGTGAPPPVAPGPVTVTTDGDLALPVTGLQPETQYRWSATATSAGGSSTTTTGLSSSLSAGSFVTPRPIGMSPPRVSPRVAVYGNPVTLTGILPRGAGVAVALQKQPFPFLVAFAAVAGAVATAGADGGYTFTVPAFERARYAVSAVGYVAPVATTAATVRVSAAVRIHVARLRHHRFAISGRYLPNVPAAASLYRVGAGRVGAAVTPRVSGTTGRAFRFAPRALRPGTYEVRLTPPAATGIERTHSASFTIPRR